MAESIITLLPLYEDSSYRYNVILGNVRYGAIVKYNSRTEVWYLSIQRQDGTPVISSLALLPGLFHGVTINLDFYGLPGYFILISNTEEIRYEDINPRQLFQYYSLYYIEEV